MNCREIGRLDPWRRNKFSTVFLALEMHCFDDPLDLKPTAFIADQRIFCLAAFVGLFLISIK
jgi:hypothetical protein